MAFSSVIILIQGFGVLFTYFEKEIANPKRKHKNLSFQSLSLMTVPVTRQPNIEPGLSDQMNIALNLFNTVLQTTKN